MGYERHLLRGGGCMSGESHAHRVSEIQILSVHM